MATTPRSQASGVKIRFPAALDIKDIITIVSVAVSLTIAWGVFSTRLALVEHEIVSMKDASDQQSAQIQKLEQRVRRLENHQQDDELFFDQVFAILKRPDPIRRAE